MIPRATYRIQFHAGFRFADAVPLAPYLANLGISHLYASPIGTARAGSTHGYDVVDPTRINPELGGENGFRALAAALRDQGLGIILDIVPNHMAVGGSDNRWWLDVLEHGEDSAFARFFDIDWRPADPTLRGRLLAPFLGAPYADVLASGDLVLDREADSGRLSVLAYGTHRFPLRPEDAHALLEQGDITTLRQQHDGRDPQGAARLHALLERQHYRLASWRTAGDCINWRRFFDITELAGLRVEDPAVFDAVHALPLRLFREGLIDGVRVDHVDGLADPAGYCRALRAAFTAIDPDRHAYLLVEKILAAGERLDPAWATDGTSGYEFMDHVSALQHDARGEPALAAHWRALSGRPSDFGLEEHAARVEILARSFAGQRDAAVAAFHRLAQARLATRDITAGMIRRALEALLAVFPSYRTYAAFAQAPVTDDPLFTAALADAATPPGERIVLETLADWISGRADLDDPDRREAVRRFEQLSAPLSAKSVEDTAFYRYGRLLSRNDVGFAPADFALDTAAFAVTVTRRAADHPHAMLTTATHDHKRGEDVRARLAVLSEIPDRWIAEARRWGEHPANAAIDPADVYMMLQTLVGACPLDDAPDWSAFADRVIGWNQKALREAKLRSAWAEPDTGYEAACADAIRTLLHDETGFRQQLVTFVAHIASAAAVNGIAQSVLRATLPGVPDCYQGTEFWDLSLVDPDNRRPVDYGARIAALAYADYPHALVPHWRDGRLKQAALAAALRARRTHPALFADGTFEPVAATGARCDHVVAFLRRLGDLAWLVAVPRHVQPALADAPHPAIPADWWQDTALLLPGRAPLSVRSLFADLPFAIQSL
ncbi:MAG TPA: malto-oligosyltrehalose synthase [Sphingomonas sp.]|jgi:(1->4)-alpha-D-glucan 1-alpha-D-glucosylmutase|uniref:malto-oligosyltrehalose synthase n=1 Tax=Sphingomonas sp. TaxID=28214 RepID=UPI002ED78415